MGAGRLICCVSYTDEPISIHAPVWGRAGNILCTVELVKYFNSRPRVGAGVDSAFFRHTATNFNSRPRVGAGANLHKCKVLFMCKMVETRDRINVKRWIISKLVQYTSDGFVLLEQRHPGRYCANLPAYFVLPRSAQQPAYRRIGSPVCTRPVRPMVSMRV